jgi:hypothetical protein
VCCVLAAEKLLARAVELNPFHADALDYLGQAQGHGGRLRDAEATLVRAVAASAHPSLAPPARNLGESKRLVIESPWSQPVSTCQRF